MMCVSRKWIPQQIPAPTSASPDLGAGGREVGKAQEAASAAAGSPRPAAHHRRLSEGSPASAIRL